MAASDDLIRIMMQMQEQQTQQQIQHEQLMGQLINQQAAQAQAQGPAQAPAAAPAEWQRERLVAKFFQCQQFSGKQEHWADFAFRFKRAVRSQSTHMYDDMTRAESAEAMGSDEGLGVPPEMSATLYDILCQHVDGEALMVMKAVRDCNGLSAWQALFRKYNPVTFARRLRLLTNVVMPGKIKNCSEVDASIILWEEKVGQLARQFNETLTPSLKTAILINAVPNVVQDHVMSQMTKDNESSYEEVKDIIKRFASRKAEASGPTPMDVGNLQTPSGPWSGELCQPCGQDGRYDDYDWRSSESDWWSAEDGETPVNGVSDAICYNCGGRGHVSPSCPSPSKGKSKGKGGKGKGQWGKGQFGSKGGGKGVPSKGYKGGKGSKGKGKGYQGTCWGCGQVGHKQTECTNHVPVQGAEGQGDGGDQWTEQLAGNIVGSVVCGSVWEAGNVEVVKNHYESPNRFAAFTTTDDEEDDDEEDDDSPTAVWKQVGKEEWEMEPAVNLSPLQLMKLFGKAGIPDTQEEEMEEVDDYVESGDETIEDFGFGPESDEDDSPPPAPTATPTTGRANQTPPPAPTATPTTGRANVDRGAASVST